MLVLNVHVNLIDMTTLGIHFNCLGRNKERKDTFGRRNVVESYRFHPTLILFVFVCF